MGDVCADPWAVEWSDEWMRAWQTEEQWWLWLGCETPQDGPRCEPLWAEPLDGWPPCAVVGGETRWACGWSGAGARRYDGGYYLLHEEALNMAPEWARTCFPGEWR